MVSVFELLGITDERNEQIMEELKPASGIVRTEEMAKRIIDVAQGKPTNEVLYLGVVLMLTIRMK